MRVLIIANHYAVCSARYATAAFQRLGHEVRHVGPAMGRRIWGLDLPPGNEWTPDAEDGHMIIDKVVPNETGSTAYLWKPDLAIVMDSDTLILDRKLPLEGSRFSYADHDVPFVVWGVDNHVRDYRRPYFEHYFLAHRNVSVMAWNRPDFVVDHPKHNWLNEAYHPPYNDMTHLPCCYDPTMHTPSPIAYEDRTYDVAMIGYMYPQRWSLVKELRAAGLKVLAGTGLVGESYRDAYHNARISLCVSSNGDVAQRVFETAAMGCVVMSDDCADYALLDDPPFVRYFPSNDVIERVKTAIERPNDAKAIIQRSLEWVKPHTWDSRAQVVVDWFEKEHKSDAPQRHENYEQTAI